MLAANTCIHPNQRGRDGTSLKYDLFKLLGPWPAWVLYCSSVAALGINPKTRVTVI